jgi:hypothetical protein
MRRALDRIGGRVAPVEEEPIAGDPRFAQRTATVDAPETEHRDDEVGETGSGELSEQRDYYVAAHPLWMSEEFENESPDGWATYGSSAMKLGTLFGCAPDLQGYTAASSEGSPASNTPERNFLRVIQPVQLNWLGVQLQLETFNRRRMP